MGICIYCGNKAGLFKDHHKECEEKNRAGKVKLEKAVLDGIVESQDLDDLSKNLDQIAKESFIPEKEKQDIILEGYDRAVDKLNEDNIITKEEESKLVVFQNHFGYTQEQLNKNKSFDLLAKASILRRLANNEEFKLGLPDGFVLPIIIEKGENLLWAFAGATLYQPTNKTTYQGNSQGVSLKITKGVYYRMGASKGTPVTTTEMKFLASGVVFYTTKAVYFSSPVKSVKIPFNKIIGILPYGNGISIQKDGTSTKPFIFQNVDGPFLSNIIATSL